MGWNSIKPARGYSNSKSRGLCAIAKTEMYGWDRLCMRMTMQNHKNAALGTVTWMRWVGTSRNGFPLDEHTFYERETQLTETQEISTLRTFTTIPGWIKSCRHFLWRNTWENSTDTYQKRLPHGTTTQRKARTLRWICSAHRQAVCRSKQARAICLQGELHTGSNGCMFSTGDPEIEGSLALIIILKYYPQLWCQPGFQAFAIVCTTLPSDQSHRAGKQCSRAKGAERWSSTRSWPKSLISIGDTIFN